ncbi:hypothetical protein [Brevibacterium aurantiacum]|uniref:Uncharacterized protein n=1 Tax=Brevibacterium aurantiacum TaxID=273384 RepID=A0A2A3WZ42_BREAU|nr:hypothetical protein [Brevibacterium aurantiacum]PCC16875.1 hypothetical protein CIK79_00280 [Brevibacterium aurantiacum]
MTTHHSHPDDHHEPTTTSMITVAVSETQRAQTDAAPAVYSAEAARPNALEQHRRSITLAAVAQFLVHEHRTITEFTPKPQHEGHRSIEALCTAMNANGQELAVRDMERHAANELLNVRQSPALLRPHENNPVAEDRTAGSLEVTIDAIAGAEPGVTDHRPAVADRG